MRQEAEGLSKCLPDGQRELMKWMLARRRCYDYCCVAVPPLGGERCQSIDISNSISPCLRFTAGLVRFS